MSDNNETEPDLRDDSEVEALTDAGGEVVGDKADGATDVEGPNPA